MNLLLDTHIVLWYIHDDEQLPDTIRKMINDGENRCMVSYASIWEMAIKFSIGKLKYSNDFAEIAAAVLNTGIEIMPLEIGYLMKYVDLPLHHRDPFDRLIISQAISEGWKVISVDEQFKKYDVDLITK